MSLMYTQLPYPELVFGLSWNFWAAVVGAALGTFVGVGVAYLIIMLTRGRFWE